MSCAWLSLGTAANLETLVNIVAVRIRRRHVSKVLQHLVEIVHGLRHTVDLALLLASS